MITNLDIAMAAVFVAVGVLLSAIERLKLERDIIIAAIRALVQLMLVGYVLRFVFAQSAIIWTVAMIFLMSLVGAWTSAGRAKSVPGALKITVTSMVLTVGISLVALWVLGILPPKPRYLIPVAGMVIGNSMNTLSISLIRLSDGIRENRDRIEVALALGKTPIEAVRFLLKKSLRLAVIPRIDNVKVSGIIHLPGAMTGMILAGASPIQAVKFQIIIMYILLGTPMLVAYFGTRLAYKRFFNKDFQLLVPAGPGKKRSKK